MRPQYFIASRSADFSTTRLVIAGDGEFRRFDYPTSAWVLEDSYFLDIGTGSLLVEPIDEADARTIIEANGGTWTPSQEAGSIG